jgi:hypothetical protein
MRIGEICFIIHFHLPTRFVRFYGHHQGVIKEHKPYKTVAQYE